METSAKAKIGVKDVSFICLCMILKIAFLILYPSDICEFLYVIFGLFQLLPMLRLRQNSVHSNINTINFEMF